MKQVAIILFLLLMVQISKAANERTVYPMMDVQIKVMNGNQPQPRTPSYLHIEGTYLKNKTRQPIKADLKTLGYSGVVDADGKRIHCTSSTCHLENFRILDLETSNALKQYYSGLITATLVVDQNSDGSPEWSDEFPIGQVTKDLRVTIEEAEFTYIEEVNGYWDQIRGNISKSYVVGIYNPL